jgi:hypothetical protein
MKSILYEYDLVYVCKLVVRLEVWHECEIECHDRI